MGCYIYKLSNTHTMYSDVLCHRCHCNACALSELMQSQVQQMDGAELHDYSFGLLGFIRNTRGMQST